MNTSRFFDTRVSLILLITGLILLIGVLRFADVQSRAMIEHDEGITLLGVTGHQGDYAKLEELDILNKWQPSIVWQHFVSFSTPVSMAQVQHDLNEYDIHPPLYFWALSTFLQNYGSVDRAAYLLNWLFAVMAILLFYPLLRRRYDRRTAAILLAVFACTPVLAGPFAVLRQYELMLLASTGCLLAMSEYLQTCQLKRKRQWLMTLCFTLCAYIGLMTHAQFLLVLAGIFGAVLPLSLPLRRKITVFCSLVAAFLMFILTNIGFFHSLSRLQSQSQDASPMEFVIRIRTMIKSMDGLIGLYPVPAFLVFVGLFGWGIWQCRPLIQRPFGQKVEDTLQKFWLLSSVFVIGLVFIQYMSMSSPRHAFGGRYFLPILPFFTLLTALWLEQKALLKQSWLVVILLLGTSVNLLTLEMMSRAQKEQRIAHALSKAKSVLINNSARGILSPILPSLPLNGQVLVTTELTTDDALRGFSSKLAANDLIWLQPGYRISAKRTAEQKKLLMLNFMLEEIGEGSGVFKVIRRL